MAFQLVGLGFKLAEQSELLYDSSAAPLSPISLRSGQIGADLSRLGDSRPGTSNGVSWRITSSQCPGYAPQMNIPSSWGVAALGVAIWSKHRHCRRSTAWVSLSQTVQNSIPILSPISFYSTSSLQPSTISCEHRCYWQLEHRGRDGFNILSTTYHRERARIHCKLASAFIRISARYNGKPFYYTIDNTSRRRVPPQRRAQEASTSDSGLP